jgi:hypothetical protein
MFKQLWKTWTIDKPAAFGDWLWETFVVQFAALLNRLTLRRVIAIIPLVILILAYAHRIPIPPELMLVGDALAYIDVLSVILLLGVLSRIAAGWLFARQAVDNALKRAGQLLDGLKRFDVRRARETRMRRRKRLTGRNKADDEWHALGGVAWA